MPIVPHFGISKLRPPEEMLGHTLEEAGLAGSADRHGISVLAIRRGRTSFLHPAKDEEIKAGDVLIFEEVIGPKTGDPDDADPAHRLTEHFAFALSPDEFELAFERLRAAGIPYGDSFHDVGNMRGPGEETGARGSGKAVYFFDPNKHLIEFAYYDR